MSGRKGRGRGRGGKSAAPRREHHSAQLADQAPKSDPSVEETVPRKQQGESAHHDMTTALNIITPEQQQHHEGAANETTDYEATVQGHTPQVIIHVPEKETGPTPHHPLRRQHILHRLVLQIYPHLMLALGAISIFYLWGWIEKRTGWYIFTNYRGVGVLTNELQGRLAWTGVAAFLVGWSTGSAQKTVMGALFTFIAMRLVGPFLGSLPS